MYIRITIYILLLIAMIILIIRENMLFNKSIRESKKRMRQYDLESEAYAFLMSDESDKADNTIASICNELGILLESDKDDEMFL